MITRRAVLAVLAGFGVPLARAQSAKVWRIGFLGVSSARSPVWIARMEALRAGLRELGYVEGKNITIESRWAENDYTRLQALADELVKIKVDVLVTASTPGAMAAKRATRAIPIVLASIGDPTATGVVHNLARPGGNVTGLAMFTPDEMGKRLELLRDAFSDIQRVGILINPDNAGSKPSVARAREVAAKMKLDLHVAEARTAADFERALAGLVQKGAEAVAIYEDPIFTAEAKKLVALALRQRLPTIGQVAFAEAGGLIGNGANQNDLFRRAADFIDRILKGAKPGDLPVQQPARFELVVNASTATALGVTLPKAFLFRADRLVE